eukprot:1020703-Amphidinium_carterae.1
MRRGCTTTILRWRRFSAFLSKASSPLQTRQVTPELTPDANHRDPQTGWEGYTSGNLGVEAFWGLLGL